MFMQRMVPVHVHIPCTIGIVAVHVHRACTIATNAVASDLHLLYIIKLKACAGKDARMSVTQT